MKKQLIVALGLAVLATPAFASKARLQALGEDQYGSFYVNDNRNVFLNAANVNNHKDLATFEWGATTAATDATATPRSEGGVFKTMGTWFTVFTLVLNQILQTVSVLLLQLEWLKKITSTYSLVVMLV